MYQYHCEICGCPSDIWEPLVTYQNDRSCEFYSDVSDAAQELQKLTERSVIFFKALLNRCKDFKNDYLDIPDFNSAVMECYNILDDCGFINY